MSRPMVIAVTLAVLTPSSAHAEHPFFRSEEFLHRCSSYEDPKSSGEVFGLCFGYLVGIRDRDIAAQKDRAFCIPQTVTNKRLMDTVLDYFRANPARHHMPTVVGATQALAEAFPCSTTPVD